MGVTMYKGVRLPIELIDAVDAVVKKGTQGFRSRAEFVATAVRRYLEELERKEGEQVSIGRNAVMKANEQKFCSTCGARLADASLEYCPDTYSCGNHLHFQGRPHDPKSCAFCKFPLEVEFAIAARPGMSWEEIKNHLELTNTLTETNAIIQAAKLELGVLETEEM